MYIINCIKEYKKEIIRLILSFITFLSFLIYFKIIFSFESYNILITLFLLVIYLFYKKYDWSSFGKKERKYAASLSLITSFVLIVGSIVNSHIYTGVGLIFDFQNIVYTIVGITGFLFFFRVVFALFFKKQLDLVCNSNSKMTFKCFIVLCIVMIGCWLPYFLRYFPAVMTNDSYYTIRNVLTGTLSDFHTFGHTWFVGAFLVLGKAIFGDLNIAVGFYTIIQMLICSVLFTYMLKFLYENGIKFIFLLIIFLFMCFSPLFAIYSITLWRDVLFGMAFITLFISLYNVVSNNFKFTKLSLVMYLLSVLFILFFRNNGIYVILLFVPFFIVLAKGNRKFVSILNISIIILYFIIKGPIFDYFGVQKTKSVEAYSIPLQQIARTLVNEGDIDKESYKFLNSILDIQTVKDTYNPTISDYVKRATDNDKLSENKIKFLVTWIKVGIENPRIYIDSYLSSTLGYWYPDVNYWATAGDSESIFEDVKLKTTPLVFKNVDFSLITSRKIPLSNLVWSIGFMVFILIASTYLLIYNHKTKFILAYIPLYCLWFTIMIASPVFAELRYVYALFTCLPLVVCVPFIKKEN